MWLLSHNLKLTLLFILFFSGDDCVLSVLIVTLSLIVCLCMCDGYCIVVLIVIGFVLFVTWVYVWHMVVLYVCPILFVLCVVCCFILLLFQRIACSMVFGWRIVVYKGESKGLILVSMSGCV